MASLALSFYPERGAAQPSPSSRVPAAQAVRDLAVYDREVTRWDRSHGLPHPSIRAVAEGLDGFMWFGTLRGLIRFDGRTFRTYDQQTSPQLWAASIGAVAVDAAGDVWVGTSGGLNRYSHGGFTRIDSLQGLPAGPITSLLVERDGRLRVAIYGRGLWVGSGGKFSQDSVSGALVAAKSIGAVLAMVQRPGDDGLWLATSLRGVVYLRPGQMRAFTRADGVPDDQVTGLAADASGRLVVTTGHGVGLWGPAGWSPLDTATALRPSFYGSVSVDAGGTFWIASKEGLVSWKDGKVVRYTTRDGLSDDAVGVVFADRGRNIWISGPRGLDRVAQSGTALAVLNGATVAAVCEDGEGTVWISTDRTGLWYRTRTAATFVETTDNRSFGPLHCLPEGGVLFTPSAFVVARAASRSTRRAYPVGVGAVDTLSILPSTAPNRVITLSVDASDQLWIGTNGGGLFRQSRSAPLVSLTAKDGLPSGVVTALSSSGDTLWIGTESGVTVFSSGRMSPVAGQSGGSTNFTYAFVHTLHGTWVGTLRGLGLISGDSLRLVGTARGGGLDQVRVVANDGSGGLWLVDGEGLARVRNDDLLAWRSQRAATVSPLRFSRGHRLENGATSTFAPHGVVDSRGVLWVGTAGGIGITDTRQSGVGGSPPVLLIDRVDVGDSSRAVITPTSIRLQPGAGRVEVSFAAPLARGVENLQLRYRLDGYEAQWTVAPSDRWVAAYTNLAPGVYQLQAEVSNGGSGWRELAPFTIQQLPSFSQNGYVRIGTALIISLLALVGIRKRIQRADEGQRLVLSERLRIAGEIHDTLLQDFTAMSLQLHTAKERAGIGEQQAIEQVLTLVNRSVHDARRAVWDVRLLAGDATDLVSVVSGLAARHTRQSDTAVRVQIIGRPHPLRAAVDSELRRIAAEAIQNAVRHARVDEVHVTVAFTTTRVILTVQDSGVGIAARDLAVPPPGHWGLLGMKERAARIGASLSIVSTSSSGTCIRVTAHARDWIQSLYGVVPRRAVPPRDAIARDA